MFFTATKIDLRKEGGETVSTSEGQQLRRKIKAKALMECSAKTGEGLSEVFENAIREVVSPKKKRDGKYCNIL